MSIKYIYKFVFNFFVCNTSVKISVHTTEGFIKIHKYFLHSCLKFYIKNCFKNILQNTIKAYVGTRGEKVADKNRAHFSFT